MDELKLLEDFRAAVAPPDDEVLARARAGILAAGSRRPGSRAGSRRRRVRWPQLAVSGAVIAALAVTLSIVLPGGAGGTFITKAWAVERNPDGTVTVTMDQQIQDPAGVQRALRADGINAWVQVNATAQGSQGGGQVCSYAHLVKVPAAVQRAVITSNQVPAGSKGATQASWTIHPSAMPPGSSILFADWVSSAFSALMNPAVLGTDTAPVCTA
jgi:hypothetical protein